MKKSLHLFSMFLFCLVTAIAGSPQAQAGVIKIDGSLPRDLGTGKFRMTVTISGISKQEHEVNAPKDPTDQAAQFAARFSIKLPEVDSAKDLPYTKEEAATAGLKFFATEYQAPHSEDAVGDTWTYTYYVEIAETEAGELKAKADASKQLKVNVFFYLGGEDSKVASLEGHILKQEVYVVNDAPAFAPGTAVVGSHQSLRVFWTHRDSVAVKGGTEATKAPSAVVVYAVDREAGVTSLPAKKFSGAADTADADANCAYTPLAAETGTCICADENVYLIEDDAAAIPGVFVRSARSSDGEVSINGLVNGRLYDVFMQYEPDGVQRSTCLAGLPSPNFSLTELNGEEEASVVDFRCFIATAAYGTPLHADLDLFRQFRDRWLMTSMPGRYLVSLYYEYGPAAADYIAARPWLREQVRSVLEVVAGLLR